MAGSNFQHDGSSTLTHRDYTVGWICALPTEMAAARGMLDPQHNPLPQDSHDNNNYILGRIGAHNVVLACLPDGVTGLTSAAAVALNMLSSFKWLRFGLMVGIGGGVPSQENDIRLGDVVVSKPTGTFGGVIQYDFGKTVQEGRFTRTGSLNRPPDVLLAALANLQSKHLMEGHELSRYLSEMVMRYPNMRTRFTHPGTQHDLLYEAEYDHQGDDATCLHCDASRLVDRICRDSDIPVVHYGLIASGNQVMRHGGTRDRLRKELDVLCFEMEAAGLMDRFPCLVIRGICDYADSHKNKCWQAYAAATAAAYAKELLGVIAGDEVADTRRVAETELSERTQQLNEYHREGRKAYDGKEWKLAIQLFKQALEGRESLLGIDADDTTETRRYYAEALYMAGNYDSAREQFTSLVFWAERKFGPNHVETLKKRRSLSYALEQCGHLSAAREQFKLAALGFEIASGGTDNVDSLLCRYKHGCLASAHEGYDVAWPHWAEAEESLQRAAQGLSKLLGAGEEQAFQAQIAYATALLKGCKDDTALVQFERALSIAKVRGLPRNNATVQQIERDIEECRFWLRHKHAQSPDRLVIARKRAAKSKQRLDWRDDTEYWGKW